jgi:hypothetical protein
MPRPPAFAAHKQRPLRDQNHERLLLRPTVYDKTLASLKTREDLQAATLLLFPAEKQRQELAFGVPPLLSPSNDHLFSKSLISSTGHKWATLRLDDPLAPGLDRPTYQAGSRIAGRLELDLPKRKLIHFIELVASLLAHFAALINGNACS